MDNLPDGELIRHHTSGAMAEKYLAEIPASDEATNDLRPLAERAALLRMAHRGRGAAATILRRREMGDLDPIFDPQAEAIRQQDQEEKDQQIFEGLSAGRLMIASPDDKQQLQNNASARAKFRASTSLSDRQKQELIARTFERDTEIRRAATPVPPEVRGGSAETAINNLLEQMDPEIREKVRSFIVPDGKGGISMMRGTTLQADIIGQGGQGEEDELPWGGKPEAVEEAPDGAPQENAEQGRWEANDRWLRYYLGPRVYGSEKEKGRLDYYTEKDGRPDFNLERWKLDHPEPKEPKEPEKPKSFEKVWEEELDDEGRIDKAMAGRMKRKADEYLQGKVKHGRKVEPPNEADIAKFQVENWDRIREEVSEEYYERKKKKRAEYDAEQAGSKERGGNLRTTTRGENAS